MKNTTVYLIGLFITSASLGSIFNNGAIGCLVFGIGLIGASLLAYLNSNSTQFQDVDNKKGKV